MTREQKLEEALRAARRTLNAYAHTIECQYVKSSSTTLERVCTCDVSGRFAQIDAALATPKDPDWLKPELPPMPPCGRGLPRYGLRWNGPQQPLSVLMPDGYWTPWHLAMRAASSVWESDVDKLRAQVATLREALETVLLCDSNYLSNRSFEAINEALAATAPPGVET